MRDPEIVTAAGEGDIQQIRELFLEYAGSLPFDLSFQNFQDELADPARAVRAAERPVAAGPAAAMRPSAAWLCGRSATASAR